MFFNNTNTKLQIEGACSKKLVRSSDGRLAVCKSRFDNNCHDFESEVMVKALADYVRVRCCDVVIMDGSLYSIFDHVYNMKMEVEAIEPLPDNVSSIFHVLRKYERDECYIKQKVAEALLFDVITRQLDRNLTNIAFIVNGQSIVDLYPLYDNGLSLFSSVPYNKSSSFRTVIGSSEEIIDACLPYNPNRVVSWGITKEILNDLWSNIPDVLISGIAKNDIINWVVEEYNYVVSRILDNSEDNAISKLFRMKQSCEGGI